MNKICTLPKVSVVTIVRNDPQGFLITARSILEQSYSNIEWIVIDGLSTDETSRYVRNLSPAIATHLIEKDSGVYNAMNKAIDLLTGEWVIFMNADDAFYDKEVVCNYVKNIQEIDDVIFSDVMRREDKVIHKYKPITKQHWMGMAFDHQTAFVKATLYKKFKYDERFKVSGDFNFFSIVRNNGYNFRKLSRFIACIKPFNTGISSHYFDRQYERVKVLRANFDSPDLLITLSKEFMHALKSKTVTPQQYKTLLSYIGR